MDDELVVPDVAGPVEREFTYGLVGSIAPQDEGTLHGEIIKQGAKLELTVKKATSGEYQLEVKKLVILAVLAKRQPQAGVLETRRDNDWLDWSTVTVQHNELLDAAVNQ